VREFPDVLASFLIWLTRRPPGSTRLATFGFCSVVRNSSRCAAGQKSELTLLASIVDCCGLANRSDGGPMPGFIAF
jgi:hypothetical protein